MSDDGGMTYSEAGVDIEAEASAIEALIGATGEFTGDFAGLVDIGDRYLALATDCVGTKILVAEALADFSTIGIDAIAMNVNDLVAAGVEPVAFVDYVAVEAPDEDQFEQVGEGLAAGAEQSNIALVGGETSVVPEVVRGTDMAGTCAGLAEKDDLFDGEAQVGDALVGLPSSGIHANGLTLARKAATKRHEYTDPFPLDESKRVGDVLLEPTRIYTDALEPMLRYETHAAAHVTGGGWLNLIRMGDHHYEITDPFDVQPVFDFIQEEGDVSDEEMHRTFNMGTGFVVALPPEDAVELAGELDEARLIGTVKEGEGTVGIRGMELSH